MSEGRILIVEDDPDISNMLQLYFKSQGYEVHGAMRGSAALDLARDKLPNVIVLDIMLPDIDGYEVCRRLRTNLRTSHIPIIFLTQKDERSDKIRGLELGADDYITKPFSPREMVARVKAVLRRVGPGATLTQSRVLEGAGVTLDLDSREVTVNDEPVDLTPTQMRLLQVLMEQPGRVFSTDELLDAVWDYRQYDPHLVETHISNLRNRIEDNPKDPQRIVTVRSFGYKFVGD